MKRTVTHQIQGVATFDGAGVDLVRVLGPQTTSLFDPILMLDAFDSTDPDAYTAGFPMHPHRGIETISYVAAGKMMHRDSLGFSDTVADGEVQWMTAGSGILHEEQIPPAERLLGVQLWLNLPAKDKMAPPAYHSIKHSAIPEVAISGGKVRVLAGRFGETVGFQGQYVPIDYYDIHLTAGASVDIPVDAANQLMIFTLVGDVWVGETHVAEKTAARLADGDTVSLKAAEGQPAQILLASAPPLGEPIAWQGPIVMNSDAELRQAFHELQTGTFMKEETHYDNE